MKPCNNPTNYLPNYHTNQLILNWIYKILLIDIQYIINSTLQRLRVRWLVNNEKKLWSCLVCWPFGEETELKMAKNQQNIWKGHFKDCLFFVFFRLLLAMHHCELSLALRRYDHEAINIGAILEQNITYI